MVHPRPDPWPPPGEEQLPGPKLRGGNFGLAFREEAPSSLKKTGKTKGKKQTEKDKSRVKLRNSIHGRGIVWEMFFFQKKKPEFSTLEWFCHIRLPLFFPFKLFPKFDPSLEMFPINLSQGTKLQDSKAPSHSFLRDFGNGIPHSREQLPELQGV